jgi:serine/arginine repetitive matrix protein 2
MPRSSRASDDLYEDPRDDRYAYGRDDRPSSYAESSASTTRGDKDKKKARDKDKDKDKDRKVEKRRSTRSVRSGSLSQSQAGGYRGDIVESPKQPTRSFSGQIGSEGFSQFPGQAGAPLMSGALPSPHAPLPSGMSSHVQDQFPGQDPSQFASSALPGGNPFGAAADYYQDMGQSVTQQPGVRPQPPSVIIGQDTPHLTAAAAQPNPVADTGSGAAADFYGGSTNLPSSKPPRPSSMPGAFFDDDPAPQKPPRPSSNKPSKPNKPAKLGSAATLAGGAALGYAMGHSSNNTHQSSNYSSSSNYQSTSYTNGNGNSNPSSHVYNQSGNPSYTTVESSNHIPTYSQAMEGAPPPKPPRPGKPEKHSSGSNAALYAAGAAGLAAYGLHHHDSHSGSHNHSHNHTSTTPGAFPGQHYNNGLTHSPSAHHNGGMAQRHQHTGPVSRFVDWWKDYEDVQKMEEYTEYIGVCKYCFDPRSSVTDAPRKHYYGRRRSSEYMRPSGGIEKQSRYALKEKKSHSSFSSGDERRKKHNSSAAGWVAAGLGGIGLAKAGKAVLSSRRDDFDDTYSIKSGRSERFERDSLSRISGHSRSRSRDRKAYSYGTGEVRRRSHSRDRMSQMSVGVTSDKKDYKVIRRHSRSRSRSSSSSRDGKSGFGTALGVGLAGAALGAAVSKGRKSRSRSRSPKKALVQHRRDSSDDERRRRRSQQLRRKSSRSSASGASVIDISQNNASQSGFFGGFFSAPAPKIKRKKSITPSYKKKKKGFFSFGNASSSSSDSEMAFGTGYVARRRRSSPKRRNSDERLKLTPKRKASEERLKITPKRKTSEERLRATLAGLGATAAAIAAAKAARASGKHHGDVVAVKQHRHQRKSIERPRPGSRYGDDEWEDLPDDDTSESSSDAGLVYGDFDWRKSKSQESLASNGSGTNKWSWRWGFGQKKRRSSENLYDNIANTSFIGPATAGAAGAITGAAISSKLGRHDSESSSVHTLQSVYPVASNDPTTFDARRTSLIQTPQPLLTSGPGAISIHQPQPVHQVPGAIYSTQAPSSQSSYTAPIGPPVFSQVSGQAPYPTQYQTQNVIVQAAQPATHPPVPRRANSSPIQTSSWKRDVAIAGIAATASAAAIAATKGHDRRTSSPSNLRNFNLERRTSSPSNVRFNLTKEQADKDERERRREQDRRDEEERRHQEQLRKDEIVRRDEEDRRRREQQLREDEARRAEEDRRREQLRRDDEAHREEERRRLELLRQQEEARKYMEAERLAKVEAERRANERSRLQEEVRAREARDAEEQNRREREARTEAQRRADQEAEADQIRRERREAEQHEIDRMEAKKRNDLIRQDLERRRIEREAQEYTNRYGSDREQQKLEYQRTGSSVSSVATDVRRKEKELEEREREVMQPDTRKSTVASAVAAGAAAAITSAAISSYKDKEKDKKEKKKEKTRERERRRDSSPSVKNVTPSSSKTYEPSEASTVRPSKTKLTEPTTSQTYEPSEASTVRPSRVKSSEPSTNTYELSEASTVRPSKVKSFEPTTQTYEPSDVSTVKPSRVKAIEPSSVVTYTPSGLQQDFVDEDIFDPTLFKKQTADTSSNKKETAIDVLKDWETRYNGPTVSQAEFFAPKELLQNDNLPKVRPVDPNEGAPNITMSEAHDDATASHSMTPPYPAAYAFVATRDGRPSLQQSWPVPSLNLIAPTPPGSRAPSVNGASAPPSPAIEPVKEPVKVTRRVPKPEDANKARSRVSWGENQFHHFEVPTPDSYRDQFVSDNDLKNQPNTYSNGAVSVERESPKSGQSTTTYKPYRPEQGSNISELPEIAPSTQYVRDEKESDWDSIVDASSKKGSKREQKKANAAAAAASADDWDDYRHDNMSVISNPFSDTHAAASTIAGSTIGSSIYTSSTVRQSPPYEPASDFSTRTESARSPIGPGYVEGELDTKPFTLHMPGGFDEPTGSEKDDDKPAEKDWDATSKTSKKGKKKSKSTDDIVVAQDTPKRAVAESISEREPLREVAPEPEPPLSKKDKKKKSKAAKRMSVDSWEESDASSLPSPSIQRDIRDIEPPTASKSTREPGTVKGTSQSESKSTNVAAAAMAGGFAALLGTSMKQDQDRIASDFEHARQSFQSADKHDSPRTSSSPPSGRRTSDNADRSGSIPGTTYDEDDLVEAKTPRGKKNKRHSSGRWSPTIGSPLRTETKYEDYIGPAPNFNQQHLFEAPKVPTESALTSAPQSFSSRNVYDSGYHAPDDVPRREPAERDSDEFFSAGSDERERSRNKAQLSDIPDHSLARSPTRSEEDDRSTVVTVVPSRSKYDDGTHQAGSSRTQQEDDNSTVVTAVQSRDKYDDDTRPSGSSRTQHEDDPDHEGRHRQSRESRSESREQSRDRTYGLDDGGERKRRHRHRETDDPNDDWDTRSTFSEARSEATSERRRKHKRRESERDGSPESMIRSRSSAASEPGDLHDDRKSSRRKSRRDDDDNASVISTSSRHDDDRGSKKDKEKRPSGLFGLFSKSKENLAEAYNKSSSKPKEEEEEEGKHRRRKHRSDRGSTYGGSDDDDVRSTISSSSKLKGDDEEEGKRRRRKHRSDRGSTYGGSDDDDTRSTISSSSRREKRSSRSERGEGDRRDTYDEKVHRSSYVR